MPSQSQQTPSNEALPRVNLPMLPSLSFITSIVWLVLQAAPATGANTAASTPLSTSPPTKEQAFAAWIDRHQKTHDRKDGSYAERYRIWLHNTDRVQHHNRAYQRGETLYAMTIDDSPFADWTDDEFAQVYLMQQQQQQQQSPRHCAEHQSGGRKAVPPRLRRHNTRTSFTSPSIDWRTQGVLTDVKNQGHCGSCWSFSTTATVEAHACILHDRDDCDTWTGLSEQQLVDCSVNIFPNSTSGCGGGWPSVAMEYIKYAGGLEEEEAYPYRGEQNPACLANATTTATTARPTTTHSAMARGIKVVDVFNITYQDEDDLQDVVQSIGPVSVAFQVSPDFRFYSHGIYDAYNATTNKTMCRGDERFLNHAVVIVGMDTAFDTTPPTPYYIIRNSWGSTWGMEGHFAMLRGVNLCGVSDCATFPILARRPQSPPQQRKVNEKPRRNGNTLVPA